MYNLFYQTRHKYVLQIYGGVVTNNITGLTALLVIVYAKDLTWTYSAEILTILMVCGVIGLMAYSCTTYPLWTCLLAFFIYPFSLVLYYVIQYISGWGWAHFIYFLPLGWNKTQIMYSNIVFFFFFCCCLYTAK